jgi:hypothetical protein
MVENYLKEICGSKKYGDDDFDSAAACLTKHPSE